MDERLLAAARAVGGLTALDMAVCLARVLGKPPLRRFPAVDAAGGVFLDFAFANGDLASAYVAEGARELGVCERREHMAAIALKITEADVALASRPSRRVRAVLRLYKNDRKVHRLQQLLRESASRNVDFAFIRDAVA
nr:MAG: hypothetical protein [Equine parapoxvirus]WNT71229.1 MAG: hypothetical protein [Equine parapoxvirus]WNT71257.1 MAG: hypothetical protein [Equine parapoxvirus]